MTVTAASSRCIRNVVLDLSNTIGFEEILEEFKEQKRLRARHRPRSRRLAGQIDRGATRPRCSQSSRASRSRRTPQGPALGRHRRRVLVVDEPAGPSPIRKLNSRSRKSWGTAVTVQAMVFGNMGETSATGVAFTRNPSDGRRCELYGEFLVNAQGEDVVAGIRTPQNITEAARRVRRAPTSPRSSTVMPAVFSRLRRTTQLLESHYRDMQDIEFTVERGKLWMLQTRIRQAHARSGGPCVSPSTWRTRPADHRARRRCNRIDPRLAGPAPAPDSIDLVPSARPSELATFWPAPARRPGAACRARSSSTSDEAVKCRQDRRPQGDPGPGRDLAGRHPRHACRGRHPDHPRRHDLACSRRGARHGQALRGRARARSVSTRPGAKRVTATGLVTQEGRLDDARRLHRAGAEAAALPMLRTGAVGRFRKP